MQNQSACILGLTWHSVVLCSLNITCLVCGSLNNICDRKPHLSFGNGRCQALNYKKIRCQAGVFSRCVSYGCKLASVLPIHTCTQKALPVHLYQLTKRALILNLLKQTLRLSFQEQTFQQKNRFQTQCCMSTEETTLLLPTDELCIRNTLTHVEPTDALKGSFYIHFPQIRCIR